MQTKEEENIHVFVRVRPLNSKEINENNFNCIKVSPTPSSVIVIDSKPESKSFFFDSVFPPDTTQNQIYDFLGEKLSQAFMEGYNVSIFAYGQTGSGKTHTMVGVDDNENMGIQPRSLQTLFAEIHKQSSETTRYKISVSCFEIYNENLFDLLSNSNTNLNLRENLRKGVYVEGLQEEQVNSADHAMLILQNGISNRHVASTAMNRESSRSHCVFSINMRMEKEVDEGSLIIRNSSLHFVDLAGSERQKSTLSTGERLKEAGNINRSLCVLGHVINSLVEGKPHIPYRDSKLTFYLKDSLGGNSRTFLIANISPAHSSMQETLSTLRFAQRTKEIKNKAKINEETAFLSPEAMQKEIFRLRDEIKLLTENRTFDRIRIENCLHDSKSSIHESSQKENFLEKWLISQNKDSLDDLELSILLTLEKILEEENYVKSGIQELKVNCELQSSESSKLESYFNQLTLAHKLYIEKLNRSEGHNEQNPLPDLQHNEILQYCTKLLNENAEFKKFGSCILTNRADSFYSRINEFKDLLNEKKHLISEEYDLIMGNLSETIQELIQAKQNTQLLQMQQDSISSKRNKDSVIDEEKIEDCLLGSERLKDEEMKEITNLKITKQELITDLMSLRSHQTMLSRSISELERRKSEKIQEVSFEYSNFEKLKDERNNLAFNKAQLEKEFQQYSLQNKAILEENSCLMSKNLELKEIVIQIDKEKQEISKLMSQKDNLQEKICYLEKKQSILLTSIEKYLNVSGEIEKAKFEETQELNKLKQETNKVQFLLSAKEKELSEIKEIELKHKDESLLLKTYIHNLEEEVEFLKGKIGEISNENALLSSHKSYPIF